MQHVWRAPRPGRFLALAWVMAKPGILKMEGDLRAALHQFVFIVDPRQDLLVVERIRIQFNEIERTARVRFRRSRLANALVGASPVVFLLAAIAVSEFAGGNTDDGMTPALGVTLAYLVPTVAFAAYCDRRTRQSVQLIEEFAAPEVLRSRLLGEDRLALRQIAQAEKRSAGEQRQLLDILWRIAEAERVRTDYLESVVEFDDEEFAPILQRVESAEADLQAWSTAASPL
ncbi:hypothetical protein C8K30_108166 [Promicromonospora sp. AC04]|nr:hypothetical protein C8K30_108166 [Promicromonospora sp. AC04]